MLFMTVQTGKIYNKTYFQGLFIHPVHKSLLKLIKPVICVTLWLYFSLVTMILYVQDLNEDKMLYKN